MKQTLRQFMNGFMLLGMTSLLPACKAVGDDYKRPDAHLPSTYSETSVNENQASVAMNQTWWTLYQDSVLNDLVDAALKNNTNVKLAVARIQEADAYAREVGAATLPQIDLQGNATRTRVTESGPFPVFAANPQNNYKVQFGTNFEIDFWGKLARAKESARAQLLATQYAKETIKLSMASLVANYYLQLRSLDAQLQLANNNLISRDKSLVLTKHRLEGGIVSALDVYQAEVASNTMRATITDLTRQRALAEHQLATLTGMLDLKLSTGQLNTIPMPPAPPAGLPSALLANRPDVRQAEAILIANNANIGFAKAALYPSISLTASLGGESLELGDVLKSASRIWTGGLSINLPIFNSGKLNSKIDQASAIQKQALAQYEAALQSAFREVNDALVNLRQYSERESVLISIQESANKALKITENRYQAGYTGYFEVLDAQRTYNETAVNVLLNHQAKLSASVELFKALGGDWKDTQSAQ